MQLVDFLRGKLIDLLVCSMVYYLYIKSFSRTKRLSTLGALKMVPGIGRKLCRVHTLSTRLHPPFRPVGRHFET